MKKGCRLLLAASLMLALLCGVSFAADSTGNGKTVILYTGNIRGDLSVYPKIAQVKKDYQAKGADVILVDTGNYIQGSAAANHDRGLTVYELMDAAGYDAAGMGLAEFGYTDAVTGYPYHGNLTRYYTQAMLQDGTEEIAYSRDKNGEVAAVLPAKEPAKFRTVATNIEPNETYSFLESVVIAGKSGGPDVRLYAISGVDAEQVQDGFVRIGAWSIDPAAKEVTIVLSNTSDGEKTQANAEIRVRPEDGFTVGALVIDNGSLEITKENVTLGGDDPAVAALVQIAGEREIRVIGNSEVILNGADSANRNRETNLGDLTCDALKWYAENYMEGLDGSLPVVAIQNGGNCDSFLYTGEITETDLLRALPFSPMGVGVLQVTGAQLLETLEAADQRADSQGFAQVAGLTYTLDLTKDYDGGAAYGKYYVADSVNRVSITSVGGKDFDPEARYNLVCDNYLINGNDTFYTLKELRTEASANYVSGGSGMKTRDIVARYIEEALGGTIGQRYASPAGRINRIRFADVGPEDYFFSTVEWAVERGITSGVTPVTFGPNQVCTRAQALTFLWRASGSPTPGEDTRPYPDVPEESYFRTAVVWAAERMGTTEIFGDTLCPEQVMTRGEMMELLWYLKGCPAYNGPMCFTDVAESDRCAEAVRWAAGEQITSGLTAELFGTDVPCTRAQVMTFLYRCLGW